MAHFRASPTCLDCGVLHGRSKPAFLCLDCKHKRRLERNRSEKYRAYQVKWNRSPKAKIVKARWERAHPNWRKPVVRPPAVRSCATLLCENTFIRPKASHRKFCQECQIANYGKGYILKLARQSRPWRRAA